jgi:hypothetical protein
MKGLASSALLLLAAAIPAFAELMSSPDGTCGSAFGYTCKESFYGGCCGKEGKCGSTADVCGSGCQSDYGYCSKTTLSKRAISCPSANNTVFTSTNGDTYTVECGIDHSGGDIPGDGAYVSSLDSCIALCSATTGCVDVSWVEGSPQGPCYLKSSVGTANANGAVWGAKLLSKAGATATSSTAATASSTATPVCPGSDGTAFTASNGDTYTVECGIDHSGGDIAGDGAYVSSLGACISLCSATTGCVDVSWVQGSPQGPCYLKSTLGTANTNAAVWGAKLVSKAGATSATATTSASATPTASLCPGLNGTVYTDTCGATYAVECGIDRSGGDLPVTAQYVSSLDKCISLCSANSACVDVSWVGSTTTGPCYLKGSAGTPNANSAVSGARQISGCVTTSSTLSTITTSSTATSSSSTVSSATTCSTAPTLTAGAIPGCVRCEGQPGTDQFCGFDVNTNSYLNTPKTCNVVTYEFDITQTTLAPDGVERLVMVVNGQMPGPTINASWGDTVVVKVNNKLANANGTSIHW